MINLVMFVEIFNGLRWVRIILFQSSAISRTNMPSSVAVTGVIHNSVSVFKYVNVGSNAGIMFIHPDTVSIDYARVTET